MKKRVLSFLMVLAMVISMLPLSLVAAEPAAVEPGYSMILQKAHNQTADQLTVEVYLQANTADQGDVTGYEFVVTPAEGLVVINAADATGANGLAGADNHFIYDPTTAAPIAVGTDKVLVATLTLEATEGAQLPAQVADAIALSAEKVTTATAPFVPAIVELGDACADHECGHGEGQWTAMTATSGVLEDGKYYLTSDFTLTGKLDVAENAEVTICLNGYDMTTSASTQMFFLTKNNATLNICDCTATGTGADYTAGKLQPVHNHGGALRADYAGKGITINFFGGIIDGTNSSKKESSVALIYAENTLNMLGGKVQNFDAGLTSGGYEYGPIILRGDAKGDCFGYISGVTFVNCGSAIVGAPVGSNGASNAAVLTMKDVTILDSAKDATAVSVASHGFFKSVTIEGNCRFDAPVYLADGKSVTLNLGAEADVNITTASELTEEQFNEAVKMAEGGSLTTGTLLYENAGVFVTYADGKFTFEEGHTIADKYAVDENGNKIVFKAWDKTDSLPKSGNWYLLHDVAVTESVDVTIELNLDLNGKTVTSASGNSLYSIWSSSVNLYDGMSEFDADGNWVSTGDSQTVITGYNTKDRGFITIYTGGTFNMYGGKFSGNSGNNGAVVYMYATHKDRTSTGAIFNMYGGEITGNTSTNYGIISAMDPSDVKENKKPGEINIFGGKIYGNTGAIEGTIRTAGDTVITITGGEFYNNTAASGGMFYMSGNSTLTIHGGTFENNSAIASLKANEDGSETIEQGMGGVIYLRNTAQLTIPEDAACEFSNNSAHLGGVIYMANSGNNVDIKAGTYDDNEVLSVTYKVLSSGAITDKTTTGMGGVIYLNAGTATVKDISPTKNSGNGAVFYVRGESSLTAEDSVFTDNTASNAGVAYVTNEAAATFKNCTMTGNTSTSNGSVFRVDGSAVLTLEDTMITGNYTSAGGVWACGALYHTGAGQKVILKGATMIAGNTSKQNPLSADYVFQGNNNTPTVYVNELTDGAHVNIYNLSPDGRAAADLVKIAEGGSQTSWDCGWINYYETSSGASNTSTYKTVNVKNVSRVNGEFVFGHWHGDQEYTAISAPSEVTADGYYYLAADMTTTATWGMNYNMNLCFNGQVITGSASTVAKVGASTAKTVTFEDCTGFYNDKDEYIGGGITSTSTTSSSGRGLRVDAAAHTVNWNGGKIFGITAKATGSIGGVAIWQNKGTVNINGGAICNNTLIAESTSATYSLQGVVQMNSGTMTITGGHFYGNKVSTAGTSGTAYGVIRPAGATFTSVKNAKFFDNESGYGVAMFVSSNMTITDCEFRNNTSTGKAGAIGISLGQTATGKAASAHTVTISNCLFEGNTAGTAGGAIFANVNTHIDSGKTNTLTLNIKNGTSFVNNEATAEGGAIRTNVTTDSARKGSANPTVKVFNDNDQYEDILFEGNVSGANGGAIYAGGTSEISTAVFTENETTGKGGAFFTENSKVTMTNCAFNENSATSTGGAVYASNGSGVYNFTDCDFTGNSGANGAAINIEGGKTFNVKGCNFDSNTATGYGGAICTRGNNMTANVGKNDQGVGCTFTNNTAKNGGAIAWDTYNRYTNTRNVDSSVFTGNYASAVGGAMYISCGSGDKGNDLTASVTNCTIENNGAGSAGAALGIQGYTHANLSNTTIQNNKDYSTYGAIYLGNDNVNLTLSGLLTIKDNKGTTYPDADIVLRGDTNPNPHLIIKDLDPASRIGIQASNARYESDPVMSKGTTTLAEGTTYEQINECFFSNAPTRFRTYVTAEGQLILTNYVDDAGNAYQTLAEAVTAAIENGETKLIVQAGDSIDKTPVQVTEDMIIDLNGNDVTKIVVAENKTLTLIDSATNDYDVEDGVYGQVKVEGAVNSYYEDTTSGLKRYVVITNDKGVSSAHRVYLSINSKVLRPSNNGIGFKAIFAGDQVVEEAMTAYGISITIKDTTKDANFIGGDFENGITADRTPNQSAAVVTGVLKTTNDQEKNQTNFETEITGTPYIVIGDVRVDGTSVTTSMNAVAKNNQSNEAVQALLETFGLTIK